MKTTINVKGMTCDHCKSAVESVLQDQNGVQKAEVDLDRGNVEVTYKEGSVTVDNMHEAIEDRGYDIGA